MRLTFAFMILALVGCFTRRENVERFEGTWINLTGLDSIMVEYLPEKGYVCSYCPAYTAPCEERRTCFAIEDTLCIDIGTDYYTIRGHLVGSDTLEFIGKYVRANK